MVSVASLKNMQAKFEKLSKERETLEDKYYTVRNEEVEHKKMMESFRTRAETAESNLKEWKSMRGDDLTNELYKLSEKMQGVHLKSLQAERKTSKAEEDVKHYQRLYQDSTVKLESLEESFTKLEQQLVQREQQWRE